MGTSTGVKYIGKNDVYEDNILRTGLTWSKGETHILPEVMAKEFLKHPGMFAEVPGASYLIASSSGTGVRFVAPSGTVAADGTITLGTALPAVFASGVYLWLPAGAISGGSAGWYFATMLSTTVGTIAGVGSGSAYVGATSEVTALTVDVPTPAKGSASILRLAHMCSSNTNAKTARFRIGGTQYMTNAINTAGHALFVAKLLITGLGDGVVSITSENGGGSSAGGILTGVGSAISIGCTLQLATATDYLGCAPAVLQG